MEKEQPYRIIISGGGTGGHIYPAIAIGTAFRERHPDADILFVGAEGKMEMQKVPEAGQIEEFRQPLVKGRWKCRKCPRPALK